MKLSQANTVRIVSALCVLLLLVPASWARTKHSSTHSASKAKAPSKTHAASGKSTAHSKSKVSSKSSKRGKKRPVARKARGQQIIDPDRTREIQAALIREHYMSGDPTGVWDSETKAALTKFQNDNGWQSKIVPDSRALIKLGLGPSREGLLNPESAAIGTPHELGMEKEIPGGSLPHK